MPTSAVLQDTGPTGNLGSNTYRSARQQPQSRTLSYVQPQPYLQQQHAVDAKYPYGQLTQQHGRQLQMSSQHAGRRMQQGTSHNQHSSDHQMFYKERAIVSRGQPAQQLQLTHSRRLQGTSPFPAAPFLNNCFPQHCWPPDSSGGQNLRIDVDINPRTKVPYIWDICWPFCK